MSTLKVNIVKFFALERSGRFFYTPLFNAEISCQQVIYNSLKNKMVIIMGNIITYIKKNGGKNFDEAAFCEVDSLILSQISYLNFGAVLDKDRQFSIKIKDLPAHENYKELFSGVWSVRDNKRLIEAAAESRRFSEIEIGFYINEIDKFVEKQFSAVTFKLGEGKFYIAFRGTDKSIVGWKEDFNMAYTSGVPAQLSALKYFNDAADELDGVFILGGHSKGGNLSVYAAANTDKNKSGRIEKVYNHDGPGFRDDTLSVERQSELKDIVEKTVPRASLVGLLLEKNNNYRVVLSRAFPINQHNPFNWEVKEGNFVYVKKTDALSQLGKEVIDEWLEDKNDETVKAFITFIFDVLRSTRSDSVSELLANINKSSKYMYNRLKIADPELKELIISAFHDFLTASKDAVKKSVLKKLPGWDSKEKS